MYQVSEEELGPNALVQNIDILGDCGNYDHDKFPWHANMADLQCRKLLQCIGEIPMKKRFELIIGLSRVPVGRVADITAVCVKTMTPESLAYFAFEMSNNPEYSEKIADRTVIWHAIDVVFYFVRNAVHDIGQGLNGFHIIFRSS